MAKVPVAVRKIECIAQNALPILCALTMICHSGALAAAATGKSPAISQKAVDRPIKDKWAVVVGISKFEDPRINLKYPAKDAQDFSNFLVNGAHFASDHVVLLTDEQATRSNILSVLGDKWLPRVANPDDLVIIYFSSHGSPADLDVGGVNYLIASDTDTNCLYATGLALQDLMRTVKNRVHCNRVVMILDACHSGAADVSSSSSAKGLQRAGNVDTSQIVAGTGQLVIASSKPDQTSWEAKTYANGVFTKQLIEALKKRGDHTKLGEAFEQLQDKVQQQVLLERGQLQTPQIKSQWQGNDLVLATRPSQPRQGIPIETLNLVAPRPPLRDATDQADTASGVDGAAIGSPGATGIVPLPPKVILDNGNVYKVFNQPSADTKFEAELPSLLTYAFTYHWNDGRGMKPGVISFRHDDGTTYGPFQTTGKAGQGNVPNAYWECEPMVEIKAGQYTILDSNAATWSHNSGSGGCGFARVRVVPRFPTNSSDLRNVRRQPVSTIFNNGNVYLVHNRPKASTAFMVQKSTLLTSICNYHWNDGKGQEPGNITIVRQDGTVFGPWQSKGRAGQGGVANAYWYCAVDVLLKPGMYVILDSDSNTWSRNAESGESGITEVKGVVQD